MSRFLSNLRTYSVVGGTAYYTSDLLRCIVSARCARPPRTRRSIGHAGCQVKSAPVARRSELSARRPIDVRSGCCVARHPAVPASMSASAAVACQSLDACQWLGVPYPVPAVAAEIASLPAVFLLASSRRCYRPRRASHIVPARFAWCPCGTRSRAAVEMRSLRLLRSYRTDQ